jgi:seryl-tRNA synthetase
LRKIFKTASIQKVFKRTMIDINLLRTDKGGNPEKVRISQRKRGGEKAVLLVDRVLELDDEWKKCKPLLM